MPKSTKNRNSTSSRLRKPFTPLRRLFFKLELLAPSPNVPALLGKRHREEDEAGFEHLHPYDYATTVDNVLDRRQGNSSSDSMRVYAPDGSRSWTKKPAGPRSLRPLRRQARSGSTKDGDSQPPASPCTTPRPRQHAYRQGAACLALQNIDSTLDDDAVIITALECVPFNSHEDLLMMSREELVQVAQTLNDKLPRALSIDTGDERPLSFIRNAIEVLVGIRPEVPAAPMRIGTMKIPERENPRFFGEFSFEEQLEEMESLSPLSMRAKSGNWSTHLHEMLRGPQRLEPLQEVSEEEERSTSRKRCKLSTGDKSSQEFESDVVMQSSSQDTTSLSLSADSIRVGFPSLTAQEPGKEPTVLPSYTRVLRSHSQRFLGRTTNAGSSSSSLSELKGTNTKTSRKARGKRCQVASGSNECSVEKNRNSIVFPILNEPIPADTMSHESRSNSSTSASAGTTRTSDHFISSSAENSLRQAEYSADESGSAFLSTKSTLSSTSKMSVCTGSTMDGTQSKKVDGMPMEGSVDMDVSV